MRATKHFCAIVFLVIVAIGSRSQAAFVFDSGSQHVVNFSISDFVIVDDGPFGERTEVIFRDPAEVMGSNGRDDSLVAFGQSRVRVEGGAFEQDVAMTDVSELFVSGGLIKDDLQLFGDASISVTGGIIGDDVETYGGTLTITGGEFGEDIEVFGGIAELRGGVFAANGLADLDTGFGVGEDGELVIFGRSLTVNGVAVGSGEITDDDGVLSGVLADGTAFTDIPFTRFLDGEGVLSFQAVPEPSSASLVLLAAMSLCGRRTRRT